MIRNENGSANANPPNNNLVRVFKQIYALKSESEKRNKLRELQASYPMLNVAQAYSKFEADAFMQAEQESERAIFTRRHLLRFSELRPQPPMRGGALAAGPSQNETPSAPLRLEQIFEPISRKRP